MDGVLRGTVVLVVAYCIDSGSCSAQCVKRTSVICNDCNHKLPLGLKIINYFDLLNCCFVLND